MKRILVPVDASPNSLAALNAAAEMAARQQAELVGLFVEDSDLLRLTDYGIARELCLYSCNIRPIRRRDLELQLRARAERIRQELVNAASRWKVAWRFHVSRGMVRAEIQRAASEADLTVLGKVGWSQSLSGRAGSTVHALISGPGELTLILEQGGRIRPDVATFYSGSTLTRQTLKAIPNLLRLERFRILIYIPRDSPRGFDQLRRDAAVLLPPGTQADYRPLSPPYCAQLLRELRGRRTPGMVILNCESPDFQGRTLNELVNGASVPVLLVKRRGEESRTDEAE